MNKRFILCVLLFIGTLIYANSLLAQNVLQGDSSYLGVQCYQADRKLVSKKLGYHYRKKKLMSHYTAKLRGGGCISGVSVYGTACFYKKKGVILEFREKRHNEILEKIHFVAPSTITSSRGITRGVASFADVVDSYGTINFDKKDNALPSMQEVTGNQGQVWYTSLCYPGIRFLSIGRRKPGEDILRRKVDEIWLE